MLTLKSLHAQPVFMEDHPGAMEVHPGLVEVYLGDMEPHLVVFGGSPWDLGGSFLVYGNTRNFAKLRPFSYKISTNEAVRASRYRNLFKQKANTSRYNIMAKLEKILLLKIRIFVKRNFPAVGIC